MRILITGGAGFIGSHVAEQLLELGHKPIILDRRRTRNISHIIEVVDFIYGDIRNFYDCVRAIESVDVVLHLGALINVDHSVEAPYEFYETNVRGTVNMLEASRQSRYVNKFVLMSTAEVYGTKETGLLRETDLCDARSPYAASKYAAERYCLSYYHTYGRPEITIIRGFNVYGPRQSANAKGAVTAKFITRMLRGKPPLIFGGGSQERDYVYVKDMARGIAATTLTQGIGGEIINLASGKTVSVNEIVTAIWNAGNLKIPPKYVDSRPGEVMRSCGDPSKALRLLGWKVETGYYAGMKETIEYYRSQMDES